MVGFYFFYLFDNLRKKIYPPSGLPAGRQGFQPLTAFKLYLQYELV
jgi:hypothetical protein